jgi:hypothetical protein
VEVCCKWVAPVPDAHCVIRITDSAGDAVGCRGGPSGGGPSSSGSRRGAKPAHCKGCCGTYGSIVAGCGKGVQGSPDPLDRGLWEDLENARNHPARCRLIAQDAQACSVRACVAHQMQSITAGCYEYAPSGPNSNTAWYTALRNCGYNHNPFGWQPGLSTDWGKAKTCK